MIICRVCHKEKDEGAYYGRYYKLCKPCHIAEVKANQKLKAKQYNEYRNNYHRQNKERYKDWLLKWKRNWEERNGYPYSVRSNALAKVRREDPDYRAKRLEVERRRRKRNRIQILERQREYYRKNREKIIAKVLAYQQRKRLEKQ